MKKIFSLLFCCMLCLACIISTAFAATTEDDLSLLTAEIVTMANELYGTELNQQITPNDIDFDLAQKIYTDTNIFELETTSFEEISGVLNSGSYIYELPIHINNDTIIANIQKGLPLNPEADFTNEEREEVLSKVGKWFVSAMMYCKDTTVDYSAQIASVIQDNTTDVLLVGSLPYFKTAVAISSNEQGEVSSLIPLGSPYGQSTPSFFSEKSAAYDYVEVRNYINSLPDESDGLTGSHQNTTSSNMLGIVGVAGIILSVLSLICVVLFINRRKETIR